jgi:hypothetical protein
MKTALLSALALVFCIVTGEASADRIRLSCDSSGGKSRVELEIDNGIVLKDGVSEPNVINLTVNDYYVSYFVNNLSVGGLLEKYEIDLRTNKLSWTGRKFEFFEAATASCRRENPFLRN